MPTHSELFDAYALHGRDGTRVRMNFVSSADGAVTLGGQSGALGGDTDASSCRCCARWPTSCSSEPEPCAPRATAG